MKTPSKPEEPLKPSVSTSKRDYSKIDPEVSKRLDAELVKAIQKSHDEEPPSR